MRIFERYMALRFLKPFLFGLAIFALLIFLGDLFDKMPRLAKSPASLWVILQYLWLEVPYWSVRIIPMATLLATLFAVSGFIQSGEWIAVQASGFEARAFFRPILIVSGLVVIVSFVAQESILPVCYARAQRLWREQIHPEWEWDEYQNVVLVGRSGQFITSPSFKVGQGWMRRPVMDYYEGSRIVRQLDAQEARWDALSGKWVFYSGVDRIFSQDAKMTEKPFATLESDLDVTPKLLAPRNKNPDEMSIFETWRYLRQVRHQGGSMREARAAMHSKLAFPFANLILCALGIPIALRLSRIGKLLSFGLALAVSFVYLWFMEMGRVLGVAGTIHPAIAAWMANLLFGALAVWLYRKTKV